MGAPPAAGRSRTGRPLVRRSQARAAVAVGLVILGLPAVAGCGDGLPDKGTVVGTVVDGTGGPLRRCTVTRTVQGTTPYPFTEEAATTDAAGTFDWDMYPGAYLITAVCASGRRELRGISTTVDVSSGVDVAVKITAR